MRGGSDTALFKMLLPGSDGNKPQDLAQHALFATLDMVVCNCCNGLDNFKQPIMRVDNHKHMCSGLFFPRIMKSSIACDAGNTEWHIWLACLHPVQRLPCTFQPHIVLTANKSSAEAKQQTAQAWRRAHVHHAEKQVQANQLAVVPSASEPQHAFTIQTAGWIFSCASAVWLQHSLHVQQPFLALSAPSPLQQNLLPNWYRLLLVQLSNGFWVTAAAAIATDLLGCHCRCTDASSGNTRKFHCGNFGLMLADTCTYAVDVVKVRYWCVMPCTVCMSTAMDQDLKSLCQAIRYITLILHIGC